MISMNMCKSHMPQLGFIIFINKTLIHKDIMLNIKVINVIEPLTREDYLIIVFIADLTVFRFKFHLVSLVTKLTNVKEIVFQPFNIHNIFDGFLCFSSYMSSFKNPPMVIVTIGNLPF